MTSSGLHVAGAAKMAAAEGSGARGTLVSEVWIALGTAGGVRRGTGEARLRAGRGCSGLPLSRSRARQLVRCRAKAERGLEAWAGGGSSEGCGRAEGTRTGQSKVMGKEDRKGDRVRLRAALPALPAPAFAVEPVGLRPVCFTSGHPRALLTAGGEGTSPVKLGR